MTRIKCGLIAISIVIAAGCDRDGPNAPEESFAILRISEESIVRLTGSTAGFPLPPGEYDASTGMVTLPVTLEVTDSDGDSAPVVMILTTATAFGRDEADTIVSITGSPRDPANGILKLVGLGRIPVGYNTGGEGLLLNVEILASLEFGATIDGSGF